MNGVSPFTKPVEFSLVQARITLIRELILSVLSFPELVTELKNYSTGLTDQYVKGTRESWTPILYRETKAQIRALNSFIQGVDIPADQAVFKTAQLLDELKKFSQLDNYDPLERLHGYVTTITSERWCLFVKRCSTERVYYPCLVELFFVNVTRIQSSKVIVAAAIYQQSLDFDNIKAFKVTFWADKNPRRIPSLVPVIKKDAVEIIDWCEQNDLFSRAPYTESPEVAHHLQSLSNASIHFLAKKIFEKYLNSNQPITYAQREHLLFSKEFSMFERITSKVVAFSTERFKLDLEKLYNKAVREQNLEVLEYLIDNYPVTTSKQREELVNSNPNLFIIVDTPSRDIDLLFSKVLEKRHLKLMAFLIRHEPVSKNEEWLKKAARIYGNEKIINLLIENDFPWDSETILLEVNISGDADLTRLFIAKGAKVTEKIIADAETHGNTDILEVLRS